MSRENWADQEALRIWVSMNLRATLNLLMMSSSSGQYLGLSGTVKIHPLKKKKPLKLRCQLRVKIEVNSVGIKPSCSWKQYNLASYNICINLTKSSQRWVNKFISYFHNAITVWIFSSLQDLQIIIFINLKNPVAIHSHNISGCMSHYLKVPFATRFLL